MKNIKIQVPLMTLVLLTFTSCSRTILNFSVLSPYVSNVTIDKSKGVPTEGKSISPVIQGLSIDEAMFNALKNAGGSYDMLIDGVILFEQNPFVMMYIVKGTAISSKDLKASLGE
jgi:hypothetical protein